MVISFQSLVPAQPKIHQQISRRSPKRIQSNLLSEMKNRVATFLRSARRTTSKANRGKVTQLNFSLLSKLKKNCTVFGSEGQRGALLKWCLPTHQNILVGKVVIQPLPLVGKAVPRLFNQIKKSQNHLSIDYQLPL